jgi:hypothetical protein
MLWRRVCGGGRTSGTGRVISYPRGPICPLFPTLLCCMVAPGLVGCSSLEGGANMTRVPRKPSLPGSQVEKRGFAVFILLFSPTRSKPKNKDQPPLSGCRQASGEREDRPVHLAEKLGKASRWKQDIFGGALTPWGLGERLGTRLGRLERRCRAKKSPAGRPSH